MLIFKQVNNKIKSIIRDITVAVCSIYCRRNEIFLNYSLMFFPLDI